MQGEAQQGMDGLGTVGTATIIATGPNTATLVMSQGNQGEVISDGNTSYVSVPTTNGGQAYITAEQYESLQAQMAASQQQEQGTEQLQQKEQPGNLQVTEQGLQPVAGSAGRATDPSVYNLAPDVGSERGYSLTTTQNPAEPGIVTSTDLNSPQDEEDKDSEEADVADDDGKESTKQVGQVYKTPRGLLLATAAEVLKSSST